jgi:hypothetical protein
MEQLGQTVNNLVHAAKPTASSQERNQPAKNPHEQPSRMTKSSTFTAPSTPGHFKPVDISYKSTPARNIRNVFGGSVFDNNTAPTFQSASFLSSSSFSSIAGTSDTRTELLISQSLNSRLTSASHSDNEDTESRKKTQKNKLELLVDVLFKFEQLEINFLAEVDKPLKEIGALCFNDYELTINKSEPHLTVFKMKLKSMSLSDKLTSMGKPDPSSSATYLLWSDAESIRPNSNHLCALHSKNYHSDRQNAVLSSSLVKSYSHENLNFTNKIRKYAKRQQQPQQQKKRNHRNDFINNMFELTQYYGQLSTSLPSELSESFGGKGRKSGEKSNQNDSESKRKPTESEDELGNVITSAVSGKAEAGVSSGVVCPSTPPPSPTFGKQGSILARSESMSSILKQGLVYEMEVDSAGGEENDALFASDDPGENIHNFSFGVADPIEMRNRHNSRTQVRQANQQRRPKNRSAQSKKEETKTQEQCVVCASEANPLVKIDVILVDEQHAAFVSKYKKINRYLNIKFSSLKLNVIPETWILLLDLLGNFSIL